MGTTNETVIKRCCAMFVGGRRCRARADAAGAWCARHRPIFDRVDAEFAEMMRRTNGGNVATAEDDGDES